ncbi:uncharacterized protein VTP21DRAFT_187 [Calcarisporiella thermophila]|uniref:uncharacterized protein n=1 Tax=Calcarisporiella thermophila TaxID=911321 RepID=UPI0037446C19
MPSQFSFNDIPDLTGRVVLVTGANTGIGKVCARELANKNAHVIIACRSEKKAREAIDDIRKVTQRGVIEFLPLDLSSLSSVKQFIEHYNSINLPIDILIANAGIFMAPYDLTKDGIESHFGVNHIGHFALIMGLLPLVEKSAPSRIVIVSSDAHGWAPKKGVECDIERINSTKYYNRRVAYGRSKLANLLFAKELDRRLREKGINGVRVNTLHPGVAMTDLMRHLPLPKFVVSMGAKFLYGSISIDDASLTQLYVATSPELDEKDLHGEYFIPIAKIGKPSKHGRDLDLARRLWEFTEKLVNEKIEHSIKNKL